jgi:hypothetical protein
VSLNNTACAAVSNAINALGFNVDPLMQYTTLFGALTTNQANTDSLRIERLTRASGFAQRQNTLVWLSLSARSTICFVLLNCFNNHNVAVLLKLASKKYGFKKKLKGLVF